MPTKKTTTAKTAKPEKTITAKSKNYIYAIGRRKTATAKVRLYQKTGDLTVNNLPANVYFPGLIAPTRYLQPLTIIGKEGKFSFSAIIQGSGKPAQLGALVHGLSRCLVKVNPDYKSVLKKAGLLTRDSRMKESRKVGMGGKARRKKQSPKR